jgi:RNA polymerase sigma factor (sigma-70 family)
MCFHCPLRRTCTQICEYVENILPSLERGRIDYEDLERIYQGRIMTHALLDNVELLTGRQRQVVEMYYRQNKQQEEIAEDLGITQQAVHDALSRAKKTIGKKLKRYYSFF